MTAFAWLMAGIAFLFGFVSGTVTTWWLLSPLRNSEEIDAALRQINEYKAAVDAYNTALDERKRLLDGLAAEIRRAS